MRSLRNAEFGMRSEKASVMFDVGRGGGMAAGGRRVSVPS